MSSRLAGGGAAALIVTSVPPGLRRAGELDRRRPDRAGSAVDDHRLPLGQLSVVKQGLPRRQAGPRHRRGVDVVDGLRLRSHVPGLEVCRSVALEDGAMTTSLKIRILPGALTLGKRLIAEPFETTTTLLQQIQHFGQRSGRPNTCPETSGYPGALARQPVKFSVLLTSYRLTGDAQIDPLSEPLGGATALLQIRRARVHRPRSYWATAEPARRRRTGGRPDRGGGRSGR